MNIIISMIVNRCSDVSVTYAGPETTADAGSCKRKRFCEEILGALMRESVDCEMRRTI